MIKFFETVVHTVPLNGHFSSPCKSVQRTSNSPGRMKCIVNKKLQRKKRIIYVNPEYFLSETCLCQSVGWLVGRSVCNNFLKEMRDGPTVKEKRCFLTKIL